MSPRKLNRLLDAMSHLMSDVDPSIRKAVECGLGRLAMAYLARHEECERLRRLHASDSHARLFARLREVSEC